ncbi:phosphotransferase [Intrasporangium chromatireducens Q5-1]|uniref:Phosphotransferase n=1 Tax=Intrasporangium chromatireducens Q5-1 TaxID=584657 RepID=W9GSH4_9MICO|nr:phosphotransferase family protein [Intrasporangium chromatireducens]EWT07783.1 phosphotransferase [Intrasporangium chromatireducens Q5-1]
MRKLDRDVLLARLTTAADRRWPGAQVCGLRRFPGGVSSLTYATKLVRPGQSDMQVVVKVAPVGLEPVKNRDVLRQARVIRLLGGQDGIRVPGVLLEDHGAPPLFVMELVAGDSYEPLLDVTEDPPAPDVVDTRARSAARMLARMQNITPAQLGVGDEPVTSIQEELDRWARLFSTVDDDICPGHAELHARLTATRPDPVEPTLLHGDYRLANMLFDGSELTAIIDWEIWSTGDPRSDLAWLLMHTDPAHYFRHRRGPRDLAAGSGMPPAHVLLDEYLSLRPGHVPDLGWFLASCHYKTASTIAVFVKRNRRLADPDPLITVGGESLRAVIVRGHEIMDAVEAGRDWLS